MPKKKGELSIEERLEQSIVAKEEEPYKLPSNWVWTRLGDISKLKNGYAFKSTEFVENGIPLVRMGNLYKNRLDLSRNPVFISYDIDSEIKEKYSVKNEDILLTLTGTKYKRDYGYAILIENLKEIILLNQRILNINFDENIKKYGYFYLKSEVFRDKFFSFETGGVNQGNVSSNAVASIYFPLPPLEEQKRIVEKLDSLFEKIQKIKEIIEEVKEKSTSRREAILSKAFSGELTEKWRGENHTENARELLVKINDEKIRVWEDECKKAEDEGRKKPAKPKLKTIDEMLVGAEEEPYKLPNNWIWTRLGDITNVVSGGTPSTSKEEYYNGNIPWITPKDLSNYKEKYILNGARNITEEGLKKSSAVLLPINSVLMSSRAPIGYVVINKKEVSTNQGFKSFTPSISYIPEYLYHYLKKSKNYLESIATGTTFKELSGDKAKKIIFPLPPLEEQKEIVRVLDKVFEEENRISELISLENKIEILEKTILDRAFRGELGTGNNDDEPAIELLRRCLEGKR